MPSPTDRTARRRKGVAATLGVLLVVAGGLAYAANRDGSDRGGPSGTAAPPPPPTTGTTPTTGDPAADPAAPDATTGPTTSPTTAPSGVAGPKTAPPAKAPAPAGADPAPTTTTTAPAPAPDPGIDPASRLPTPPGREPATFTVSGNPAGTVRPGASAPIDLTIANPNGSDLTVTAVTIAVGPPSVPACGAGTLAVSRPFSGPVVVPAHTTRSLSALGIPQSQWPALTMPQSPVNQDACQQATFPITYTGTGTVA